MISVLTYGRNDGHGYNLAKRSALSFNCIAELLDDPDDEIIFVDCNSEDDYATLPESIADTLTPKARSLLRTFRVRRSLYTERSRGSHLPVLESFSRNVGLRRANPRNRWVLSTNPDMVFVTANGDSLNAIVNDLPGGYYATPRYELPESLWESFDRSKPTVILEDIANRSEDVRLHLAVRGHPCYGYNEPGDFQLMPRLDIVAIGGFHEGMVRGWHVDSNLAKRFSLFYGKPANSLHEYIKAYHLMHLRALTSGHTGNAVRAGNSFRTFVEQVDAPVLEDQLSDWGAPNHPIEQIPLTAKKSPVWFSSSTAGDISGTPERERIEFTDFNSTSGHNWSWQAPLDRIQLYLANEFDHMPECLRIGVWSGNVGFRDFMERFSSDKRWDISLISYSVAGKVSVNPELSEMSLDIAVFDFTIHFLAGVGDPDLAARARANFHISLIAELFDLGYRAAERGQTVRPKLYCLGVKHTDVEGLISGPMFNWDQLPFPLCFKRGRFGSTSRRDRLASLVKWQSARRRMAAQLRGRKTVTDRIMLELLRLAARLGTS